MGGNKMSRLKPFRNDYTPPSQIPKFSMDSDKETAGNEVTVIQENNACREDIEGLPNRREEENKLQ